MIMIIIVIIIQLQQQQQQQPQPQPPQRPQVLLWDTVTPTLPELVTEKNCAMVPLPKSLIFVRIFDQK